MSAERPQLSEREKKQLRLAIAKSLASLQTVGRELGLRVAEYLASGGDATVTLDLVQTIQQSAKSSTQSLAYGWSRSSGKKLFELFTFPAVPAGYYRRLGEVSQHINGLIRSSLDTDARLPDWMNALLMLRSVVDQDSFHQFPNENFQLHPIIQDVEGDDGYQNVISVVANTDNVSHWHVAKYMRAANDWLPILEGRETYLDQALQSGNAVSRETVLQWLHQAGFDFTPILSTIVEFSVGSSKLVRAQADKLLPMHRPAAGDLLRERLIHGTAAERSYAAEKLFSLLGNEAAPALLHALDTEKGKRVRQSIENCLQNISFSSNEQEQQEVANVESLPVDLPSIAGPLPEVFTEALWGQFELAYKKLDKDHASKMEQFNSPDRPRWLKSPPPKPKPFTRKKYQALISYLEGATDDVPMFDGPGWFRMAVNQISPWSNWADLTSINLLHVVRLFFAFEFVNNNYRVYLGNQEWLEAHRNAQSEPYDLRYVDAALATLPKFSSGDCAQAYIEQNSIWQSFLDWEPDAVWPLFLEQPQILRSALLGISSSNDCYASDRRLGALRVVATVPSLAYLSREIEEAIWSLALGEAKTHRKAARLALQRAADRLPRVLSAINDGKQAVRIAGAEMAGEMDDSRAIEPLKKALGKEKQELVRGAMLLAVEQLGGDVQEFMGREKQLADAEKGLAKKHPKGMEWVPLDRLPQLHWVEDNQLVTREIVAWWVVQSIKFKQPICGPVLKRSLDMCDRSEAAELAQHVLSLWISEDTRLPTPDEQMEQATTTANSHWGGGTGWLKQHYGTVEAYRDALLKQNQTAFTGSAIGQKGILAIVAAAGDADCVKMIERYIRTHHGNRVAQSKALLETLGFIEAKSAVQLLLSLANRFRTKSIRKRAEELVNELAERQGWTMAELADRTIPDGGFTRAHDDDGNVIGDKAELVLDYGSRTFSVVLNDDLLPVITRADGKQIKSMPTAAKADDVDMVKAAKKEFSAAKKAVKEVVRLQAERFYESACLQRTWPATEWQTHLASHPIVGALCHRVVWAAYDSEDASIPSRLFRPIEDGTMTDVDDEEFELSENQYVRVAHSSLLDTKTEEAWKQHLEDYEVPKLFRQFGRETFRLAAMQGEQTGIDDFCGHMLTTFRLRNRATKLGWQRGDTEDGGTFWVYHKPFRLQGIAAVVSFTGSFLPEDDMPAALKDLYFEPMRPIDDRVGGWNPQPLKLSRVPAVLLSECYNDVREMAAEGTGFDRNWEKVAPW